MKTEFNHAANDSPRSGSTKKVCAGRRCRDRHRDHCHRGVPEDARVTLNALRAIIGHFFDTLQ